MMITNKLNKHIFEIDFVTSTFCDTMSEILL